jgi:adenylate cyclase
MRTENLAIVFIDIAGFTPRMSSQTREENLRMLQRFEGIVRPLVRAYSGRVVKTIGDAFLLTFRSPTDALLCSMAIHDRLAESNAGIDTADRFTVRAAVNVGDVRIESGDVFGEAVNIAARIESLAGAGEIYFSESAFLSMTRTEVPCEEIGYTELKGIAQKVRLYRVPRAEEGLGYTVTQRGSADATTLTESPGRLNPVDLPFGGVGLNRMRSRLGGRIPADAFGPMMDSARGLVSRMPNVLHQGVAMTMQGTDWWRTEVKRSRTVQYATVIAVIVLVILITWFFQHRPSTPWQKFLHKLGQ